MNSTNTGLIFTIIGCTFLMISFSFSEPFILWAFLTGTSVILNVTGTTLILKSLLVEERDTDPSK